MAHNENIAFRISDLKQSAPVDLGILEASVGYLLQRALLAVSSGFRLELAVIGLRPVTFSILVAVRQSPGLRQSAIADALGIQRTNLVALIEELCARGWLDRARADGRSYALRLTDPGQKLMDDALAMLDKSEASILEIIEPADRDALIGYLRALAGAGAPASR